MSTPLIDQLQAFFHANAAHQYRSLSVPPFTLYWHPQDPFPFYSYAIPDIPVTASTPLNLAEVQAQFRRQERQPRVEFIAEYAPELGGRLAAGGFVAEGRDLLMICRPDTRPDRPPPDAAITITVLTADSPAAQWQTFMALQRQGFNPGSAAAASLAEAESRRQTVGAGRGFVAAWAGRPVAAGLLTAPANGCAELTGIATLGDYRRRGIASALTAAAVAAAFRDGLDLVCLSAASPAAGRVYERVGFTTVGTMLSFAAGSGG